MMEWSLLFLGLLAFCCLAHVVWSLKKRKVPARDAQKLREAWQGLASVADPHRRVLDAEKIVDQALGILGYRGTFADKLRLAGPRFSDIESLWRAHKLRNRIAHEMNAALTEADASRALAAFRKGLDDLL